MGTYLRADSPFWWMLLEPTGARESTRIPVDGGTDFQTKENKKLAQQAYAVAMGDLARNRYDIAVERPRITFKDYRAWYLDHVCIHHRNYTREKSMLGQLGTHLDRFHLDEINRDVGQEWMTARKAKVKAGTVKRELETLKALLSSSVPRYLAENPLKGFPGKGQLRIVECEPRILTRDEETRLLDVLTDPQDRALIICAIDTLMRLSDIVNLERRADHGTYITVVDPKTKTYKVPVSKRLRKALNRIVAKDAEAKASRWVFPKFHAWTGFKPLRRRLREARDRAGDRSPQHAVARMFSDACARAEIDHGRAAGGMTFHCLRHTGASRALENGADVRTVQELGGWSNLRQLTRYTHPTEAAKQRAVDSIGKKKAG
jgi:integrase